MSSRIPRIIAREAVSDIQRWDAPAVDGEIHTGVDREPVRPLTASQLQGIQRSAYDEGFALGRREGREAGLREIGAELEARYQQKLQTLSGLLCSLARPIARLDEEVERSLLDLVVLIARQLIRRELKTSQGEIVAVLREALASLPIASRHPHIHLNPDDIDIVRQAFSLGDAQEAYKIEEDPLIARGGCLIETETSYIDATVEARINAAIAQMFGSQREADKND
ncbi:MAG: flagellar assembly protein FliH [Gammaproteobacteria bacterium]